MTKIIVYQPSRADLSVTATDFYARLDTSRQTITAPFNARRMALIAKVGDALLRGNAQSWAPTVTHFAFWIRNAALQQMAKAFTSRLPPQGLARPRGLVFHLPPQNVETVFLYSWIVSYLAGNANIVRLPEEISVDMRAICDLFLLQLQADDPDAAQYFVHYPSLSDVSFAVSARSDVRVVWGGDAKVKAFANVPLRRGGKSIWFGDRFSFSVTNGAALVDLDDERRRDLARKLYNDIFVFDQMACSSPHILYVVGNAEQHFSGAQAVIQSLIIEARSRDVKPATGQVIRKMVESFAMAASGDAAAISWRDAELTTVFAHQPTRLERRIGGGFLRVHFVPTLSGIVEFIREHDQTATHFGFTLPEIEDVARASATVGVSRWTPVGSALDFDYIWDGYDLPSELTSLIRVR